MPTLALTVTALALGYNMVCAVTSSGLLISCVARYELVTIVS